MQRRYTLGLTRLLPVPQTTQVQDATKARQEAQRELTTQRSTIEVSALRHHMLQWTSLAHTHAYTACIVQRLNTSLEASRHSADVAATERTKLQARLHSVLPELEE